MYCALAHAGVNAISSGKLTPCCAISNYLPEKKNNKSLIEKLNHPNLIRIRGMLKADIWPTECNSCKQAELAGANSLRTIFNSYGADRGTKEKIQGILEASDIHTIHLSVGNKCNSKCMTCNPGSSSLWHDEWKSIWKLESIHNSNDPVLDHPAAIDELLNDFVNLKKIIFLGGEPTINHNYVEYLHKLIASGRSKDIDLSYVTNLTGINDSLLDLWSNFRHIDLGVSIDAYGAKNDYIRYPIRWNKIEMNLRKFLSWASKDKISIGLSLTPSAFNCIHLDEIYKFWYELLVEYDLSMHYGISLNKISYPMYTSMRITSVEYRQQGIDKLINLRETIATEFYPAIDHAIEMLSEPMLDEKIIDEGKYFIQQSDLYRNNSIQYSIPELYNELWKRN